jgi:hypothetical protein
MTQLEVPLSVRRWVEQFEHSVYKSAELDKLTAQCTETCEENNTTLLFLRLDQARELLRAARTLREKLVIRYFLLNGLAPTELSLARLEGLDPVNCTLFLPKRHWKRNCLADIDAGTVHLQLSYAGNRVDGPLIRGRADKRRAKGSGLHYNWLNRIVHKVADRTCIAGKERVSPIVLKRTFAREWLLSGGGVGTLQKQFSHKHLWSTAHYLRFVMEDVKPEHTRMVGRVLEEA